MALKMFFSFIQNVSKTMKFYRNIASYRYTYARPTHIILLYLVLLLNTLCQQYVSNYINVICNTTNIHSKLAFFECSSVQKILLNKTEKVARPISSRLPLLRLIILLTVVTWTGGFYNDHLLYTPNDNA